MFRYFFCFVRVNRNKEFVRNFVKYSGFVTRTIITDSQMYDSIRKNPGLGEIECL